MGLWRESGIIESFFLFVYNACSTQKSENPTICLVVSLPAQGVAVLVLRLTPLFFPSPYLCGHHVNDRFGEQRGNSELMRALQ